MTYSKNALEHLRPEPPLEGLELLVESERVHVVRATEGGITGGAGGVEGPEDDYPCAPHPSQKSCR
jgi:hypothetical protein